MLVKIVSIVVNLFARVVTFPTKKQAARNEDMTLADMYYRIVRAAGRADGAVESLSAIKALADLEKKRHQLMVLVAAVERITPVLAELAQERPWYEGLLRPSLNYRNQKLDAELRRDVETLLDVLRRIKTDEG